MTFLEPTNGKGISFLEAVREINKLQVSELNSLTASFDSLSTSSNSVFSLNHSKPANIPQNVNVSPINQKAVNTNRIKAQLAPPGKPFH